MKTRSFLYRHRHKLFPTVALVSLVVAAVMYREPLVAWFTGGDSGPPTSEPPSEATTQPTTQATSQPSTLATSQPSTQATSQPSSLSFDAHETGEHDIAYYTCSMHPFVRQHDPGTCPICSMDLTPVTREEVETGTIFVDAVRRQRIGVRTGTVRQGPMGLQIRALGRVTYDERLLHDVTLRVEGWIERLYVDTTGEEVRDGQRLFAFYSPEIYSTQQELLLALAGPSATYNQDILARAARQRLRLWGLTGRQIDDMIERGEAQETVQIRAPAGGYVIEKHVVEGAHLRPGERVYRIASLDSVWVEAEVYESDLPHVHVGQPARITLPYLPGRSFEGTVAFVFPYLQGPTRTGRVRIELPNPDLELRPEMYADVVLEVDLGERLQVRESAVIYAGPRRLVFIDLGEGRLRPQEVEVGLRSEGHYEVLSGLSEGDVVVTSGNFLVAAESRIRSAAQYWGAADETD